MTIPVDCDNPFRTDNNSQRNPLYEQRIHTFVSTRPSISLSELDETVYSALADHSQPSTMECVASTVQEIQGCKVDSLMVHWVPVKQFNIGTAICAADRAYGVRLAGRAEVYGMV